MDQTSMCWEELLSPVRMGDKARPAENHSIRSAFERDYDRIIFSHPFRKLQDKTQVHPLPEHDFVHTRLTHSLETSSVGRSLGKSVGEALMQRYPNDAQRCPYSDMGAIVAAAALSHDIGNPPFGHSGEKAISDFFAHHHEGQAFEDKVTQSQWVDLLNFEGNAQGFRILNKACYKDLRLTCGTLGAFVKYPCPSQMKKRNKARKSQSKYGFFQSESNVFNDLANMLNLYKSPENGAWLRHPLAFLVEAADDICYSIIDLEDGYHLGLVSLKETLECFALLLGDNFDKSRLESINDTREKMGLLRALAINQLIQESAEVFLDKEKSILNGDFDQSLTSICDSADELKKVSQLSQEKIYAARHAIEIEVAGHVALQGLLKAFIDVGYADVAHDKSLSHQHRRMMSLLPSEISLELTQIKINNEDHAIYFMLRTIIDFVAGMTDRHIFALYKKINGTYY